MNTSSQPSSGGSTRRRLEARRGSLAVYRGSRLSHEIPSSSCLGRYPGNSYSDGVGGGVSEMARDGFGLVTVAHLRLARMYHRLSHVCVKWGEPDRARGYMRQADAHLAEAE